MKLITDITTQEGLLEQWKGHPVEIWQYAVTHRKLFLRLDDEKSNKSLFIVAISCERIEGPFGWQESDLSLERMPPEFDGESLTVLRDSKIGFQLVCSSLVFGVCAYTQMEFRLDDECIAQ